MRLLSFSRLRRSRSPDSVAHPRRPALARGLLALAAIALAAYFFRDAILGAPVDVQEVVRGDLEQTVVASGRVTTPQPSPLAPSSPNASRGSPSPRDRPCGAATC